MTTIHAPDASTGPWQPPPVTTYRINDCYPTIQGEGMKAGTPVILLRMHGCAVGCPFCDTKHAWGKAGHSADQYAGNIVVPESPKSWTGATSAYVTGSAQEVAARVVAVRMEQAPGVEWVLLTGGEPAEQPLRPLISALHDREFSVMLETSGTAQGHLPDDNNHGDDADWVCVSPKLDMPGRRPLRAAALNSAQELKFVIGRESDFDDIGTVLGMLPEPDPRRWPYVSVQPMSESKKATELCINAALRFGYHLSIQTHKLIKIA